MYEKIKFSNFRNLFLAFRYFLRFLGNKFKVFNSLEYKDFELSSNNKDAEKILIFCPSLNLDTPHFLNVGLRAFINATKYLGVKIDIIQCFNFLNICHLGGSPFSDSNKMPCYSCKKVNSKLYKDINTINLSFLKVDYESELQKLSFDELKNYTFEGVNLGELVSSSIIWIKRHSDLNEESKNYFIKLINDSKNLKRYFDNLKLEDYKGILVFNGISFPESLLYKICEEKNLNVATFEGGMSKNFNYSIEFNYGFTPQHFFKFDIDKNYENGYFENQDFFKAKTNNLISEKMDRTVSIFTNVSWDTSQFVSNNIFDSMYEWLENLKPLFKQYKSINFVIKPHPGENRRIKETFYTVSSWYEENIRNQYSNVSIVLNNERSTSYKLLKKSNLVLVYNSTIGIEAAILGKKVIMSANSHYSSYGFVDCPKDKESYFNYLKETLNSQDFEVNEEKIELAKKYYYQLSNEVAYPLDKFIEGHNGRFLEINDKNLLNRDVLEETKFLKLVRSFLNQEELKYSY